MLNLKRDRISYPFSLCLGCNIEERVELMGIAEFTQPSPLRRDAQGVLRIGSTRIPLDTVINCFHLGYSPEEMIQQFPTLNLVDVYAAISIYLHNRESLDAYLEARRKEGEQLQQEIMRQPHMQGIRERLLARRKP